MSESTAKQGALRLLRGLENGGMTTVEGRILAEDLDPVLVHAVMRYLREAYPISNPAAGAVLERLVALTSSSSEFVAKSKEGARDPVTLWFTNGHSFGEFRGRGAEMIGLLIDKLED